MWDPYAEFESAVLPNGLTVFAAHWPGRTWVATSTLIHSGARVDEAGLEGTAHFVEHLCSRNTPISYQDINKFFESSGGGVRLGATGFNDTYFDFFSPIAQIDGALSIFGSMLVDAKLRNFIESQRQVIQGEHQRLFKLKIDAEEQWKAVKTVFGEHWRSRFITPLGDPDSIARVTAEDLQGYYDKWYTPANMSFISVGGLALGALVDHLLKSPYGFFKDGYRCVPPVPLWPVPQPRENRYIFEFSKHLKSDEPLQTGAYQSEALVPIGMNEKALFVLRSMLNKVLFEEIREKRGWTYQVGANTSNLRDVRTFSIGASALALDAIDTIEQVVEDCLSSLAEKEGLMEEMKSRAINSYDMVDITGKKLVSRAREDIMDEGSVVPLSIEKERYASITLSDVLEVREWLRPERRFTRIVVP